MDDVLAIILGGGRGTRLFPLTLQALEAGRPDRRQVPPHRHPHQQLPELGPAADLRADAVQLGEPEQAHRHDLQVRRLLVGLRDRAGRRADRGRRQLVPGDGRRRPPEPAPHAAHAGARHADPVGRPALQMDYRQMLETHRESGADATVAVIPVAARSGVRRSASSRWTPPGASCTSTRSRPRDRLPALVSDLPGRRPARLPGVDGHLHLRARGAGAGAGQPELVDFGRHVIPDAVPRQRVQAHVYRGYWEDVGTIQSYFQANLALCDAMPAVRFLRRRAPRLHAPALPARRRRSSDCDHPQRADLRGVHHARRRDRARRHRHPQPHRRRREIRNSLLIGADHYETLDEMQAARRPRHPAHRHRRRHRHRERDHRQERAHRPRRPHHRTKSRRQGEGRRRLLHPRGDRDRPQERRHPRRDGHLTR